MTAEVDEFRVEGFNVVNEEEQGGGTYRAGQGVNGK